MRFCAIFKQKFSSLLVEKKYIGIIFLILDKINRIGTRLSLSLSLPSFDS
jgi:hypothetical protein